MSTKNHLGRGLAVAAAVLAALVLVALASVRPAEAAPPGTVWAWGSNYRGQLGIGTDTSYSSAPVKVKKLSGVKKIGAGAPPALALKENGTVWAWGNNQLGALGNGTTTQYSNVPVKVKNLTGVEDIAGGFYHALALKEDGTVWAWGMNTSGQLGNGTTTQYSNVPVKVKNLTGVRVIDAGGRGSLALKKDGTVWAWGDNAWGQLGNSTTTDSNVPVKVKNLTDVKAIAAGWGHRLALKENGTVWAWGMNDWGQLGIGPDPRPSYLPPSYVPVKVKNLTDAKAIAAGYGFSLALKKDGTVRAWGDNDSGQLGNGPRLTETTLPVDVKNLTDAKAIAAGDYHSLALKENGTVWAWGDNAVGQLGNATTLRSYVPVKVINLTDVKAIAASTSLSMALKE